MKSENKIKSTVTDLDNVGVGQDSTLSLIFLALYLSSFLHILEN